MSMPSALVGDPGRLGAIQRVAIAMFILAAGLVCLSFGAPGRARYALFVAAHALVYSGFLAGAIADITARRHFSWGRLCFALVAGVAMMILGPIIMAAAEATT